MWVGFQDDPVFRWDGGRTEALDRARENGAAVMRTLVDWSKVAPTQPRAARRTRSTRRTSSSDVDEFVRNAQQRGLEVLITLWGTPAGRTAARSRRRCRRSIADFQNFARAIASRYSGRFAGYPFVRFFTIWNESNLATFLVPQFNAAGRIVSPRELREAREGRDRRDQGGERPGARRDRRDVLERP